MTLDALLVDLAALDIALWADGERLFYDAPAGALTGHLRAAIACHRGELLCRLSPAPEPRAAAPTPMRCPGHGQPCNWVDAAPASGRVRTTCKLCGGFVGSRPARGVA